MNDSTDIRSSFHEELLLLYRYRRWLVAPLAVSLLSVALYNFLARPIYRTETVIAVEGRSRIAGMRAIADPAALEAAMTRELTLLTSPDLIEAAVNASSGEKTLTELASGPVRTGFGVLQERYADWTGPVSEAPTHSEMISSLATRIAVVRTPNMPWLTIQLSSHEPLAGAELLNTLVDKYQERSTSESAEARARERELLASSLGSQKEAVGETLGALSAQSRNTAGGNPAYQRPMIQRQLGALQDQYASVSARMITLAAQLSTPPDAPHAITLLDSARAQTLRARLDALQSELAAKQQTLGERHPDVLALLLQVELVEKGLKSETAGQRERLAAELDTLTRQQRALGVELEKGINKASNVAVESFDAAVLMREADAGERALSEMIERSQRGGDALTFEPRVMQRATPRMTPVLPDRPSNYLAAIAIGLVGGIGLARLRALLDGTIRSVDQIKSLGLDLPLLGVVPKDKRVSDQGLVSLLRDSTPLAEAYRVVRANLPSGVAVISVSSALPGDGKSTTSMALAILLAETKNRVLLIDADMRRPSLGPALKIDAERGLSTALREDALSPYVLPILGIDFLPAGKPSAGAAARLGDGSLGRLINSARDTYKFIIVDTPPALALADALSIGREVDGTILVASAGQTQKGALVATVEQLRAQGLRILGMVLNQVDFSDLADSYGRYYAEYSRYYTIGPKKARTLSSFFHTSARRTPKAQADNPGDAAAIGLGGEEGRD